MSRMDNPQRLELLRLFEEGRALTVVQATKLLNNPDPRSHIRYIRQEGYPIRDKWISTGVNSRCKLYWMGGIDHE